MLLRTANSSFILDLLRRSIRLCAVLLAIFLPAALVADGCFLFVPTGAVTVDAVGDATGTLDLEAALGLTLVVWLWNAASSRGFICMILRDRVGGGGRENWSLSGVGTAEERLRDLTVSLACTGNVVGLVVGWAGLRGLFIRAEAASLGVTAGGGSSKAIWREASLEPS